MLRIIVPGAEFYNENTGEFIYFDDQELELEHSLLSISKWEGIYNKPFLSSSDKTVGEILDYVRCMTLTDNVASDVYERLSEQNIKAINDYINAPMTATTFHEVNNKPSREIVTSEIIYYWMIVHNIPFECENWHLNRLLTLIKVCNIKSNPPKKMSKQEVLARNRELNAQRRKQLNTTG